MSMSLKSNLCLSPASVTKPALSHWVSSLNIHICERQYCSVIKSTVSKTRDFEVNNTCIKVPTPSQCRPLQDA